MRVGDQGLTVEAFGLEEGGHGLYVDPGVYADKALFLAIRAINDLMAATDVERLVSDPSVLMTGPPARVHGTGAWDDDWHRARYRLLAGF